MKIKSQKKIIVVSIIISFFLFANLLGAKDNNAKLSIGQRFHKETILTVTGSIGDIFKSKPDKPKMHKNFPDKKKISLPAPQYQGLSVEDAIKKRRSVRNYSKRPLTQLQLSQLLFAAQGVTGQSYRQALRTAPSAGALYPFEIYVVVNNVKGLERGIYHYSFLDHTLELLKTGDFRRKVVKAGLEQDMLGKSGVTFILSAVFDRVCHKYGQRGYRYVYMEAGHISQNICLESVSLGLGSVTVGAFLDDKVSKRIEVDGQKEAAIYMHAVGSL